MLSVNMSLPIPTVSQTQGPNFAYDLNSSLTLIDQHDHSPGKGVAITPAGLNISSDLTFANNSATNVKSIVFQAQTTLTINQALYVAPGTESIQDLWFNDGNGTQIQLTKNGLVNATIGSLDGESYAAGTFTWTQSPDALPTTPANFDIGSITIRPNTAGTTNGVVIQPPGSIASLVTLTLSPFNLTLPAAAPAFTNIMTLTSAGVMGNAISPGALGQVLTSTGASSTPMFQVPTIPVNSITGNYTATSADNVISISGSDQVSTLPTAVGITGKEYTLLHDGTSLTQMYRVATTSSQTIGGIASQTVYSFTIPSSSIKAGTKYSNNSQTFTVMKTTTSSTTLLCTATGAPTAAPSTLTFVSGSPSGNLAYSAVTSSTFVIAMWTNGESLRIVSDGANWKILDHKTDTDWASYVMTLDAVSVAPTPGTTVTSVSQWRRNGPDIEINIWYSQLLTGGNAGSGAYIVGVPTNVVSASSVPVGTTGTNNGYQVGTALLQDAGGTNVMGWATLRDSTHMSMFNPSIVLVSGNQVYTRVTATWANGNGVFDFARSGGFEILAKYPVANWAA